GRQRTRHWLARASAGPTAAPRIRRPVPPAPPPATRPMPRRARPDAGHAPSERPAPGQPGRRPVEAEAAGGASREFQHPSGVTTETHPARRDCGIDPEDAVTRVHEHEVDRATHPEGMDRAAWGNPDRVSAGECLATD